MLNISIINLGVGNITSVAVAFRSLGAEVKIVNSSAELEKCDGIVLPGVGNFKHTMEFLNNNNFVKKLNKLVIEDKIPFLGICLGMQLLAEEGEEGGLTKGLGWIKGKVIKLDLDKEFRIPHIGWDDVKFVRENSLFKGIDKDASFYFVHSYHFACDDKEAITSICNYGGDFVSSVQKGNIFGTQFHPEKSQGNGVKVLENFLGECKFENRKL